MLTSMITKGAVRLASFTLAVIIISTSGQTDDGPVVSIKNGTLRGQYVPVNSTEKVVQQYLGIPFARPPVGPLRLTAPQPPLAWEGVRDATRQPAMCIQNPAISAEISKMYNMNVSESPVSEDCLYLNVYTPSDRSAEERLPVMVWIHGGGLAFGGAAKIDASALVAYQHVVVVVIQYRLGILGFLSTGDEHARGNWGFLDQIAALQWVQANIESFGGDPQSVTIFGDSAGGISASLLVLSPLSSGLFHKVICQSGVATVQILSTNSPLFLAKAVANLTACDSDSTEHLVRCMRQKTEEDIIQATKAKKTILGSTVDGYFLEKPIEDVFKSQEFPKVPILLGMTNHEFGWILSKAFASPDWEEGMDKQEVMSILNRIFHGWAAGTDELIAAEYLRDADTPEKVRDVFTEILGDLFMVFPTIAVANHHRNAGGAVYLYEFQHPPAIFKNVRPGFVKADHGDDIYFVFGAPLWNGPTTDPEIRHVTEEEKELSKKMMAYWANFARSGSPNGPGLLEWPAYGESEEYLNLGLEQTVGRKLKQEQMHFFTVTLPQKLAASHAANAKP
ncbi:carboxylesterase 3 [Brienomyrus brachyistius]|uniref:carboxylesterase 3 n=1 Tax=Brienomyrus brachyistius TaxID=42636 RepID=UPI0020B3AC99|nr:carboxylesterase 3 [Brienomyrus brachyistius]